MIRAVSLRASASAEWLHEEPNFLASQPQGWKYLGQLLLELWRRLMSMWESSFTWEIWWGD